VNFSTLNKTTNLSLLVVASLGFYLVITSAFFPLDFLSVFDAKRVIQLALFAAIMIFTVAWAPLRKATIAQLSRLSRFQTCAFALFFLIGIISSLRLEHPAYALVDVSMMFVMMVLIFVTAASRELAGDRFHKWAVILLATMGLAVVIQEFMGVLVGWVQESEYSYAEALIHFAHPRFYNQVQTWSIPILVAIPLLFPGKRRFVFACVVLLGLQWFLVIALAARGTAVSLLIAMLVIALLLPAQRKFWLNYQVKGLLAGITIYLCIFFLNGLFIPQSQSGEYFAHSIGRPMIHTTGRSMLWRLSVEDAVKHPVLGTGPTQYACDSKQVLPAHPHSFVFQILGEWGLIALSIFLLLAITIGVRFLGDLKHTSPSSFSDPPLKAMLATSLIAGGIHSCLSGLLIMPASQVTLILVGGWVLGMTKGAVKQHEHVIVTNSVLILCLVLACSQFLFSISEVPLLPERTKYTEHYGRAVPRLWQDGRVCEYDFQFLRVTE
jgi:O-antigen ligase